MMPNMRRFKQMMEKEDMDKILKEQKTGVLAVCGEDGYPYTIPMNFVYLDGKVYFHGALDGHKMTAVKREEKASFCVVDEDVVLPEKFTTRYSSVVAFGRIRLVEEEAEKTRVMRELNHKYAPGLEEKGDIEIAKAMKRLAVLELTIDHITGKASMELINKTK